MEIGVGVMWIVFSVAIAACTGGMQVRGQDYADAPAATLDCSSAMEDLSVCNVSIGASSPTSECCDTLRGLGPQCMCSIFLGPPIPGISRDQAFLLPRDCNLPRIRCAAPPRLSSASSSMLDQQSSIFLGVDDGSADEDEDVHQLNGETAEEKDGGF